jgi:two-component system, chemotaxis family, response regulator Rcp1
MTLTQSRYRNVRVLLVEDNIVDAGLTVEAFRETKFPLEVMRVSGGEWAMDYLLQKSAYDEDGMPDVILLDLNMPGRDGHWVLKEVRENPKLSHIPIIIFTGLKNDVDLRRAYEGRANFYLVKPMDLNQLLETVRYLEEVWLSPFRFKQFKKWGESSLPLEGKKGEDGKALNSHPGFGRQSGRRRPLEGGPH